jgi:hypothetical protein
MPSSVIDICNLGLFRVGTKFTITDLEEGSAEANACKAVYDSARRSAMRAFPWNFATRYTTLAQAGTSPNPLKAYAYHEPSDCLLARRVMPDVVNGPTVPFELIANAAGDGKLLLCDKSPATLVYTFDATDPNLFDASFIDAFSWRLGYELALPLTGDKGIQQSCLTVWRNFTPAAQALDAGEGDPDEVREADWITARTGAVNSWR